MMVWMVAAYKAAFTPQRNATHDNEVRRSAPRFTMSFLRVANACKCMLNVCSKIADDSDMCDSIAAAVHRLLCLLCMPVMGEY